MLFDNFVMLALKLLHRGRGCCLDYESLFILVDQFFMLGMLVYCDRVQQLFDLFFFSFLILFLFYFFGINIFGSFFKI